MNSTTKNILGIPMHQRICEIRDEKKLSNAKLESLTELSDDTIGRLCKGKTQFKAKHLTNFAKAFNVSVARLTRKDGWDERLMNVLADTNIHPNIKVITAKEFLAEALGASEISDAYRYLGRAFDVNKEEDKAEASFRKSFDYALIGEDPYRIQKAIGNLLTFFNRNKKTEEGVNFLKTVNMERLSTDCEEENGKIKQNLAILKFDEGLVDEAQQLYVKCIEHFEKSGSHQLIGLIKHNIADILFHKGQIDSSISWLEDAVQTTKDCVHTLVVHLKDLARAYICKNQIEHAKEVVAKGIKTIMGSSYENTEIHAKFILMKGEIENDFEAIEQAIGFPKISKELRVNLADVLSVYYIKAGDANKAVFYHAIMRDGINGVFTNYKRGVWF